MVGGVPILPIDWKMPSDVSQRDGRGTRVRVDRCDVGDVLCDVMLAVVLGADDIQQHEADDTEQQGPVPG